MLVLIGLLMGFLFTTLGAMTVIIVIVVSMVRDPDKWIAQLQQVKRDKEGAK